MNARWFRDNIMVLVAVVIFTGILAGSVYFLRQAMADQETVQQELESQHQSLSGLQEQKPFPSRENLTVIKDDMEQIKRLYAAIQNAALREPIAPEEVAKAIDFTQLILSTRDQLTAEAEKNNVRVPEAFAWSFSRYVATFPCKTPAASAAECQQLLQLLSKQLAIVKRLSRLLIDSRVESIGAIRRTEVEPGGSTDSLNLPIDDKNPLYHTFPFELQFTADTETLRHFLNALAQSESLYLVRSVQITSFTQQVRAPVAESTRLSTDPDFEDKPPLPAQMVEVRRLNITLRVDLIEFIPPPKPTTGKS